ncbi:MAG: efflux RND transporter periplasmic adaptor subunit, partial [Alphaproteobacteria bacterium]
LLRQQENTIQQQESTLRDRLAQLEVTKANVNRQKTLLDKGAASQVQYDTAAANLNSTMAQIENQRSQIDNAKIQLEQRRNDVEKANVRAPMDGIIAEVVSRQGQTINNNQTVPVIVRLAKMDEMTVRTQVSEADIIKVHPDQKVYFTILGEPSKRYYSTLKTRELTPAGGVLDSSAGGVNKGAVYYNVLFNVPNEDGKLFPSMTAEVHIVLAEAQHVVTVSSVALGPKGPDGYNTVQVVKPDGNLETRKVLVGVNNNFKAEIKSGLKAGEKVVTGQANVTPAAPASTDAGGKGLLGGMGVAAP